MYGWLLFHTGHVFSCLFHVLRTRQIHILIFHPLGSFLLLIYEEHNDGDWNNRVAGQEVEPVEVGEYPPVGAEADNHAYDNAEP